MAKKPSKPKAPPARAKKPSPFHAGGRGFAVGNPGGEGGTRPGAGRKPDLTKQATRDFFAGKLTAANKALDRCLKSDEDKVVIKAVELVYAYFHGRPIQRIEQTGGSERTRQLLDQADKQDLAATAALGEAEVGGGGKTGV